MLCPANDRSFPGIGDPGSGSKGESAEEESPSYCATSQVRPRQLGIRLPESVALTSPFQISLHIGHRTDDDSQGDSAGGIDSDASSATLITAERDTIDVGRLTKARLTSPDLEIRPITEVRQRTDSALTTWKWWAKPQSEGQRWSTLR